MQRVVRSLFHVYPPFVERNSTNLRFQDEPHKLIGTTCLYSWHEPEKNMWTYNFKLKDITFKKPPMPKGLLYDEDIHYNAENHCCILQVTCKNFVQIPTSMGLVLSHACMRISQDSMRYYRLRLVFGSGVKHMSSINKSTGLDTVLLMDPVVDIRVFPWWHPKYPHQGM